MSSRVVRVTSKNAELAAATGTLAAPSSASDGISLLGWRLGSRGAPDACAAYIDHASGGTITVAAGAYWAIYEPVKGKWRRVADVNGGAAVTLTAGVGFEQRLVDVAGGSRLALVGTLDTGTVLYGADPLQHSEVL